MLMSKKQPLVGFERYVELDWLDQTARWVIDGKPAKDVHDLIDEYLDLLINGATSKRKTKNVLSGAWVKSNTENEVFKMQARGLFLDATKEEKLAIHYGMFIASYPFFFSLSKILGRLFKLQDEITNAEFYRRVIETVGDRESIKRAAARYLQSLIEWGVLELAGKAVVKPAAKIQLNNSELITWLYSAVLFTSGKERLSIDDITSDPVWFPFEISHGYFKVQDSDVIEVVHQGVGSTLIALKSATKNSSEGFQGDGGPGLH